MKYVKCISLFIVYPLLVLGIGFYAGVKSSHFFYPGDVAEKEGISFEASLEETAKSGQAPDQVGDSAAGQGENGQTVEKDELSAVSDVTGVDEVEEVMVSAETLCVDTKYVLEETDVLYHTVVETTWKLPDKYVGMNREQFLQAMEVYEAFPPLSELERGFVGLEVLSFSRERVVVRMDYKFVQPSSSFYLAVYDNEVVVYLEDMKTVYIETDIRLDSLPEHLQQNIIDMMWIRDEEELYSFLENYSS